MAQVYGRTNHWLEEQLAVRTRRLDVLGVALLAGSLGAAFFNPIVGVAVLLVGFLAYWKRVRQWGYASDGAKGEFETAILLARLPAEYIVFNDIAFRGFNVDHVVVGPSGVWAIETKSHKGVVDVSTLGVRVNGRTMYRDPCRQARRNAAEIGGLIRSVTGARYWVEPLVCFPRATTVRREAQAQPIVVGGDDLLRRVRSTSCLLSHGLCERLANVLLAAQRSGTQRTAARAVATTRS